MTKFLVSALTLTTIIFFGMGIWTSEHAPIKEFGCAWIITALHGSLAFWINDKALGRSDHSFLMWGLGMNGIRVLVLLALLAIAQRAEVFQVHILFGAVFAGYFCFLAMEIAYLHMNSLKGYGTTT